MDGLRHCTGTIIQTRLSVKTSSLSFKARQTSLSAFEHGILLADRMHADAIRRPNIYLSRNLQNHQPLKGLVFANNHDDRALEMQDPEHTHRILMPLLLQSVRHLSIPLGVRVTPCVQFVEIGPLEILNAEKRDDDSSIEDMNDNTRSALSSSTFLSCT